ncbi:MAG TPA: hypothetical protein VGJ21_06375 [Terracidiphilus sp.]
MKFLLVASALTVGLGASIVAVAQFPAEDPAEACSKSNMKSSTQVNGYTFRSYSSKEARTACVQVIHNGRVIFRRTNDNDGWFTIGQPANKADQVPAIPNGTDLTGRGHPDMTVAAYSGGAHCCLSHYVFELEPEFKLLAHLDAQDTWPAYFDDLDHDGHYYYIAEDWTFAYWLGDFASSPAAPIILRWVDDPARGGFHLALDKMARLTPGSAELREDLENAKTDFATQVMGGGPLWGPIMRLIYSGHPDLAWRFLDEALPAKFSSNKDDWTEEFCIGLKESPYWTDLEVTMRDIPPACARAKPGRKG